jgi:hypothetical protein
VELAARQQPRIIVTVDMGIASTYGVAAVNALGKLLKSTSASAEKNLLVRFELCKSSGNADFCAWSLVQILSAARQFITSQKNLGEPPWV